MGTRRLYDETGSLSSDVDTDRLQRVLLPLFLGWLVAGWHARDFAQAVDDCARCIEYDHDISRSLGGLGGGKDSEAFLSTPYRG